MSKRAYSAPIQKVAVTKSSVVKKTRWRLDIKADVNEVVRTQLPCHHYIKFVHYLESEKLSSYKMECLYSDKHGLKEYKNSIVCKQSLMCKYCSAQYYVIVDEHAYIILLL